MNAPKRYGNIQDWKTAKEAEARFKAEIADGAVLQFDIPASLHYRLRKQAEDNKCSVEMLVNHYLVQFVASEGATL